MANQRTARPAEEIDAGRVRARPAVPRVRPAVRTRPAIALVVDDEPLIRHLVSRVLRQEGWSVLEAADAVAAIAIVGTGPLDLLVTDYEMPEVSGVALAERLRERNAGLPVLMVSGHPEAAFAIRHLSGRTAFTLKPFLVDELVSSVGSIVG